MAEQVEEEECEYETDFEEIIVTGMVKPKAGRETIQRLEEEKARKKCVVRTEQITVEEYQKEEVIQKNLEMEASNVDVDTDDEAEEYGAWTVRKIGRIWSPEDETGEDKMDESIIPKFLQVKHFGRIKYTHLVNEDTTNWNNPWSCYNALLAKMAGRNGPIAQPKGSK